MLRPYQKSAIDRVRDSFRGGKKAPILVCPTGSGKTVMGSEIMRLTVERGGKVLFLAHRSELIDQTSGKLFDAGVRHEKIIAGKKTKLIHPVQVASVQTLARRDLGGWFPTLIITDECHLSGAKSYKEIHERWPMASRLGLTATPHRLDGKGLDKTYDDIVMGPSVVELQSAGFLAKCVCYSHPNAMDTSNLEHRMGEYDMEEAHKEIVRKGIMGDAIENYRARGNGMTAVVFCCTVVHAEEVASAFRAAGYSSEHIEGSMPKGERARILNAVKGGNVKILVSVDLVSVGFDAPILGCAILLRPTESLTIFLQQIGRILRPYPGKLNAVVLDHVGNVLRHGLPETERVWELTGKKKKKKGDSCPVWTCDECFAQNPISESVCQSCMKEREIERKDSPDKIAGELVEIKSDFVPESIAKRTEEGRCQSRQDFEALAYKRGYKNPKGWAYHRMRARNDKLRRANVYSPGGLFTP